MWEGGNQKCQPIQLGHKLIPYKNVAHNINVSIFKMWPWELKPPELNNPNSELYQGSHLFATLYYFYKASFWEVGIHIGPNHPIYPTGFLVNFLKLPTHLQKKLLEKI